MPRNHIAGCAGVARCFALLRADPVFGATDFRAQTAAAIDHQSYRTARFLHFLDADSNPIETPPHIGLSFGDKQIRAVLDSGLTGNVVAAASIPNLDQLPVVGDGRLTDTSSGRIMLGHWVATRVSLVGQDGGYVKHNPYPCWP